MVKSLDIEPKSVSEIDDFNIKIKNHNDFIVVAVHMPGCGWCEKLKNEWKQLKNEKLENVMLAWVHMDALPSLELVNELMIDGYPFIVGYKNQKKIPFNKDQRSKKEILNWINENNSQNGGKRSRKISRKRKGGHMEMIILPALGAAGYLNYRQSKNLKNKRKSKRKTRKNKKTRSKKQKGGKEDFGTYKDGSSVFKDKNGYYIDEWDNDKQVIYKKYLKSWKPVISDTRLILDKKTKKWKIVKSKKTKTMKKSSKKTKTSRCPNGTRKNKKSGKCEKKI